MNFMCIAWTIEFSSRLFSTPISSYIKCRTRNVVLTTSLCYVLCSLPFIWVYHAAADTPLCAFWLSQESRAYLTLHGLCIYTDVWSVSLEKEAHFFRRSNSWCSVCVRHPTRYQRALSFSFRTPLFYIRIPIFSVQLCITSFFLLLFNFQSFLTFFKKIHKKLKKCE